MIRGLQHFSVGSGTPLVVYADHSALTFVHVLQNPNHRLMSWELFLQSYHLDIYHMEGNECNS